MVKLKARNTYRIKKDCVKRALCILEILVKKYFNPLARAWFIYKKRDGNYENTSDFMDVYINNNCWVCSRYCTM